jgi:hypothetical protein
MGQPIIAAGADRARLSARGLFHPGHKPPVDYSRTNPEFIMNPKSTDPEETASATPPLPRKLGANHGDTAKNPRKRDNNFKQSNDLREDRGIRQMKSSPKNR